MKTYKYHNLIKINLLSWIILAVMLSVSLQSNAQSENRNELLQMIDEDRTTIDAISGYDQEIQRHILQVAQTPEVLSKMEELQKRSQKEFRAIIENYDRDAQSAFYEMARYPNLITDLVSNGLPSASEADRIISKYPDDIYAIAQNSARRYFDVLVRIDRLNDEIDGAFQVYLEPYSSDTRESVNVLLSYPEIVSALIDDKDFTSLLGEIYSEDPQWIEGQLGQISQELAEQNKQDIDAYKNQIQNDPEAYNEMLDASDRYARENNEVRYLDNSSDPIIDVRIINSYPYWFGYPYWYSDPYWRPLPICYNTGFYRNNYGNVVFVGLPSYHFMHWQSYNHPTSFPHLSYNYYSYYENHYMNRDRDSHRPYAHNGFYRSIESNIINNPRVNNSNLERIAHQRGKDIVRRPNTMASGSGRRGESGGIRRSESSYSRRGSGMSGSTNRRGNETMNRNRNEQKSSGTTRGTFNRRGTEQQNSGNSRGALNRRGNNTANPGTSGGVNRREYNTINPGRSEGPVNRRGSETGIGTMRRGGTSASINPDGTSAGRSRQGTSISSSNNERPRSYNATYGRVRENGAPSATRQRTSSANTENRAAAQQRSAAPQQRRETNVPAERSGRASSGREASQYARPSAPDRRREVQQAERSSAPDRGREASQYARPSAPDRRREVQQAERTSAPDRRREVQQVERTSAPSRRESSSAQARTSGRSEQREARASNSQSTSRRSTREKSSSAPDASAANSNGNRGNRRQR